MYAIKKNKSMKMSFFLVLFALLSISLQAQNRISFGVKGGLNIANIYDSEGNTYSADAKTGFAAGGFLHVPIGSFLGIIVATALKQLKIKELLIDLVRQSALSWGLPKQSHI